MSCYWYILSINLSKLLILIQINLGKYSPFTDPPFSVRFTVSINYLTSFLINSAASWFKGSVGFGSINKYNTPKITLFRFKTGFQSALNIFRHTFPSRSILGWNIFVSQCTLGGWWG